MAFVFSLFLTELFNLQKTLTDQGVERLFDVIITGHQGAPIFALCLDFTPKLAAF